MKRTLVIGLLFLMTSCFGLVDGGSDRVVGNYSVSWIDLRESQLLDEEKDVGSFGIVPAYVYAVGHDNNYIIAKQHPTSGFQTGYKIDTSVTNYYIVDMNRKVLKKGEKVFGPLAKHQFDSLSVVLKISGLEFDMNYPRSYK